MTPQLLSALQEARAQGKPICLLSSSRKGALRLSQPNDESEDPDILDAVKTALRTDQLQTLEHGNETLYIAPHNPPVRIFIVGAVHIAQALLPLLAALDFRATIIDPRSAFASDARFRGAHVIAQWPDEALSGQTITARTAIVTLTHDPKLDDPALHSALASEAFYIGSLGSRRTHAQRVDRLKDAGFDEAAIARIAAPVGLNIHARSPAEIALSIAGQLVETLRAPKP